MKWGAFGAGAVGGLVVAAVVLAAIGALSAKIAAGALQLLGIGLTLLGVAVVRSSLERAADKAVEARQGLDRWWALRRESVQRWRARRRKGPKTVPIGMAVEVDTAGSITPVVTRGRVDRETVSDREWLAFLDSRVESLFGLMDQAEQNRSAERDDVNRRLAAQSDELRAEIRKETRQGWELIVAGLACSAVGTALGIGA